MLTQTVPAFSKNRSSYDGCSSQGNLFCPFLLSIDKVQSTTKRQCSLFAIKLVNKDFQTKIAHHEIQLALYYTHFETAQDFCQD